MIDHIRRWNIWRKNNLNGPIHKLFVLFGIIHSPTFAFILLPEERNEIMSGFQKVLKGEYNTGKSR